MPQKKFDPRKFIDREFEQEFFEELLEFKDHARVLAIKDAGGMGKSHLLQRFQYRCRTVKPRTSVALIALDQLGENSPLSLVQEISDSLAAFSVEFPGFKEVEMARSAFDFTTIRGKVDLSKANLSQAQGIDIGGVIIKADQVDQINTQPGLSEFTPEQQAKAQQISVQAFLADLHKHCDQQPLVIMLDAFEKCDPSLLSSARLFSLY